ncbi:MAG: hypothetical protein WA672_15045 [Candidatus Angelobacter sp.]
MPAFKFKSAVLAAVVILLCIVAPRLSGQREKDPHRPACTSAACQKIESFLKANFCGASPFGNGPKNGCDTRYAKQLLTGVNVIAAFDCETSVTDGRPKCRQRSEPSPATRSILVREMRRLGLPANAEKDIYFTVWQPPSAKWFLAAADYGQATGSDLALCQVILVLNPGGRLQALRKVQFQKTNADKPTVTTWFPLGIADVDGDGQSEIILEGDAYEDHWLEVDKMQGGGFRKVFSGLGYYL